MKRVYLQENETDTAWALYYGYVELAIGYCNNVLIARGELLSGRSYEHHHRRLVRLLITEHLRIIQNLLESQKYISPLISQFMKEEEELGWDWASEHNMLDELRTVSEQQESPT